MERAPVREATGVPIWFTEALAHEAENGEICLRGTRLAYRAWGPAGVSAGMSGCLLLHGVAANSRWWDHIAPSLAGAGPGRVVAVDLAGHGDSGRRPRYSIADWAVDVVELVKSLGLGPRPVVVGHSLGGMVAIAAAQLAGANWSRVVLIDTAVRERTERQRAARRARARPSKQVFSSRAEAVTRLRDALAKHGLPYVVEHVAQTSVRPVTGGWAWKVDPVVHDRPSMEPADLAPLQCPATILRADRGLMTDDVRDTMVRLLGGEVAVHRLSRAGHHAMLDEPEQLISVLLEVLRAS